VSDFDPRDLAAIYFWYTYGAHRVRCDRCGERSPEPTESTLATARVQPAWGGYPITGTRAAMEAWAEKHEGTCPTARRWKQEAAEQERARLRVLNPGVRGL
jgi:hypothetical protein